MVVSDNKELAKPIEQGILDGYNASASTSSRSVKTHATVDGFDQDEVGNIDIMSDTMIVGDVKLEAIRFATLREKAAIGCELSCDGAFHQTIPIYMGPVHATAELKLE